MLLTSYQCKEADILFDLLRTFLCNSLWVHCVFLDSCHWTEVVICTRLNWSYSAWTCASFSIFECQFCIWTLQQKWFCYFVKTYSEHSTHLNAKQFMWFIWLWNPSFWSKSEICSVLPPMFSFQRPKKGDSVMQAKHCEEILSSFRLFENVSARRTWS